MRIDKIEFQEKLLSEDSDCYPVFSDWTKTDLTLCESVSDVLAVMALHELHHRPNLARTLHYLIGEADKHNDLPPLPTENYDIVTLMIVLALATPLGRQSALRVMKKEIGKTLRKQAKKKP